ncbi:MAG: SGNH/GDSL hydrolase family protein [Clostridia bacterium]|nr:SGNH/GDSL hydrolase family protein [Clostridia bacterium]
MEIVNIRGNLTKFKKGIEIGKVKIGYAGGSITTAATQSNWPLYVRGWFVNKFKNVRLTVLNAAIGATGSMCGLFLAEKEFIKKNCDLVFIEYAVNDNSVDADERMRTREGLIRKLLKENIDVVLVYTFYQNMFDEMKDDNVPKSISDMELLAEHYNISSVFMAKEAYEQVEKGVIPWNAWLPDGTHPQFIGSYFYASAVISFLEKELNSPSKSAILKGEAMPEPYNDKCWQYIEEISFDDVKTFGSWSVAREVYIPWFEERLITYGLNDSLEFSFEGRGLSIIFSYGKTSGLVEYQLDGGQWQKYSCERYWWMPEENYVNTVKFFDDLPYGKHNFKMRITHGNIEGCSSSDCNILKIFSIK